MPTLALHSSRTASIDALRGARASAAAQAAGVVGFALLAGLLAQFEIRLYLWEVPISLQTVAVYGAGLVLGSRNGFLAMALYLVLGLFLPLYAGGATGAAHLAGATGGYLLGMVLAAAVIGALSRRLNTFAGSALSVLAGSAVLFSCGVTWLHFAADHASWWQSIESGWLRFIIWDLTKVAFVGAAYSGLRRLTA
jgi:biotin transport system substrate-specific component